MNFMKHSIAKVIPTVINLLVQLFAIDNKEIILLSSCISEIPLPQPFFFRASWA